MPKNRYMKNTLFFCTTQAEYTEDLRTLAGRRGSLHSAPIVNHARGIARP